MNDFLDRLFNKIDSIESELGDMKVKMAEYNEQLKQHIQGVNELKEYNRIFREKTELEKKEIELRIQNLEKPGLILRGVLYIAAGLATLLGVVKLVQELLF